MERTSPVALVFGASGQVGAAVVARLRAAGWQVLALSRTPQADGERLRWLRGDFAAMPPLPAEVDAILSCGPLDLFAKWHAGGALRAPRVLAFGSTSVHAKRASPDAAERDVADRLQEAERLLQATVAGNGGGATVLRPTLVYGAARDATLTRIATLARRLGWCALPRGATGLRQPVHVDDLAAASLAALGAPATHGRGYDLPGGETLEYREMVRRVLGCLSPVPALLELPVPVFRALLAVARASGAAGGLGEAAVGRMREDLAFDAAPARRDFGYAPRRFTPEARMFVRE